MDSDIKFFLFMLAIVFIIIFSIFGFSVWETKTMTDKGYVWIPSQQGRWEMPKGEK